MGGMVGVVSGLLGIGGGVLVVPFLYLLMAGSVWSGLVVLPEHEAAMAHATSLALIIPTALSGVLAFRRAGTLELPALGPLAVGAGMGALTGSWVATSSPAVLLKVAFGLFLLVMAARLLGLVPSPEGGAEADAPGVAWGPGLVGGGTIGFFSAVLGVGGGLVAIPILLRWGGIPLKRVVPVSLVLVVFASLAGTGGYALAGSGVEGLPAGALGYVHLPVLAAMLPGAVLLAPLGAAWNRRMPVAVLRRVFGILLLLVGIRVLWLEVAAWGW
ncbi:MAG: sulfite exporter TauE/SafE family protein [Gemmatimonadales bacterium]|nr:MAG: sulfite exporter TauE/SafE family protein [Gemmatimonadales bacterium]